MALVIKGLLFLALPVMALSDEMTRMRRWAAVGAAQCQTLHRSLQRQRELSKNPEPPPPHMKKKLLGTLKMMAEPEPVTGPASASDGGSRGRVRVRV